MGGDGEREFIHARACTLALELHARACTLACTLALELHRFRNRAIQSDDSHIQR